MPTYVPCVIVGPVIVPRPLSTNPVETILRPCLSRCGMSEQVRALRSQVLRMCEVTGTGIGTGGRGTVRWLS